MSPSTKARRATSAGLLAAVLAVGLTVAMPSASGAAEPTVTFSDDFNGSSLDSSKWLLTLGTAYPGGPAAFGTGEIQTYTADSKNVSVHDGSLYITPTKNAIGGWESARVESQRTDFKPAEGSVMTFAFNAAMPDVTEANGSGYWPAGWMNASTYRDDRWSWPGGGEFDVMESVSGGQWSNSVLHCGYAAQWGGPCNEPSGINAGSVPLAGAWGSFKDYRFEWDRSGGPGNDQLRWYQAGVLTQTVNQASIPADVWGTLSSHRGFHILFNVAIDGAYPAAKNLFTNANTEPGHAMRVNEVSVSYSAGGSVTPPVVTPPTSPPVVTPEPTVPVTPPSTETPAPTTPPVTTPAAPGSGLRVTASTPGSITLAWDAVPGATGYEVLRAGIVIPELSPTTGTSATNVGLLPSTPYIYSVRPVGGAATPEINVTTPAS